MTLTFGGAAEAGAACSSKGGESVVIDNKLAALAAATTTLTGLTGATIGTTTATSTAATAALLEFVIDGSGESEKSGVGVGLHGVHFSGAKVVGSALNVLLGAISGGDLISSLLVLAASTSGSEESLGLGGLVGLGSLGGGGG